MKAILLAFGLCGVAALGGAAIGNWPAVEVVSGPVMQKIEDISGAVMQKAEDVSGAVVHKAADVSGAVVQKVADASGAVMQKVEDASGAVVQKVSAAIDSWQGQPVQATAEPSRAIVSGPSAA
ncbi:hypothetical protein EOA13_37675, partial [Mesorhizobium sp. M7A.F.Ca.US.011.01.1.1]|uniref:hypothetical protein n=1 Tax=Mesorhizobium sp. M7A.F.Ca.US.011.01.1.1 TaxID=2496741 RepID=UPI000FD5689E